jgi:membrane protease YdiL (CAAX protease family)
MVAAGGSFSAPPAAPGLSRLVPGSDPTWVNSVYEVGTYLLTACFIWWERKNWPDFHVYTFAVVIIVIAKPIETLILAWMLAINPQMAPYGPHLMAFPRPLGLSVWLIAIILVVALRRDGIHILNVSTWSFRSFLLGMAAGVGAALLIAYPLSLQITPEEMLGQNASSSSAGQMFFRAMFSFVYQLGMAAVSEEPLFRGFLWGHLRKLHWRDGWICLFQAALFSLAHVYYVSDYPISFWFIVPVGGLVTGLVAWHTRSIAASMATHGIGNSWGRIFGEYLARR